MPVPPLLAARFHVCTPVSSVASPFTSTPILELKTMTSVRKWSLEFSTTPTAVEAVPFSLRRSDQ